MFTWVDGPFRAPPPGYATDVKDLISIVSVSAFSLVVSLQAGLSYLGVGRKIVFSVCPL